MRKIFKFDFELDDIDYSKSILELVDTITSFEVYNPDNVPKKYRILQSEYSNGIKTNKEIKYSLILRDDINKTEIWLSGPSCGPNAGTAAYITKHILMMLRLRVDFDLRSENTIIVNDLEPNLYLNYLLFKKLDNRKDYILKVSMKFNSISLTNKAREILEQFGDIEALNLDLNHNGKIGDIYEYFNLNSPLDEGEYATNYAIELSSPYSDLDNNTIQKIIKDISMKIRSKTNGEFMVTILEESFIPKVRSLR